MVATRFAALAVLLLASCGGGDARSDFTAYEGAALTADQCPQLAQELRPAGSCLWAEGTCSTDADCHHEGCSGEVCAGGTGIYTTCVYRDCFNVPAACRCVRGCCAWTGI